MTLAVQRGGLALACVLVASTARAQESESTTRAADATAPLVVLDLTGEAAETEPLADTITELMARLHVHTTRTEPATQIDVLAHVRIDLRAPAGVHVVVAGKHDERSFARDVPKAGSALILRETVAHEVRAGVEAQIFEEERIAAEAKAAPAPVPPAAPVPAAPAPARPKITPPPRWGLDLGAFAAGGPIAEHSGVAPRFGALVAVASRARWAPTLTLSVAYALPFDVGIEPVRASTWFVPLRLAPSVSLWQHGRTMLTASVGVGLDLLHVEPRSDTLPRSALAAGSLHADPLATAALGIHVGLTPALFVFGALGLDADLATRNYVVDRGPKRDAVLEPWRLRPALTVGIAFTAAGGASWRSR